MADGEGLKTGQTTNRDLPHTVREKKMPECDLLVMTWGTCLEWLPAVQAKSNTEAAGSEGALRGGLCSPRARERQASHTRRSLGSDMLCYANS